MSGSLATKYRPHTFDEVVGQESIVKILKRQIELGEIPNSLLFCGSSGCGKTTLARIFANDINKNSGRPIEIDAASNNGVDNVRSIIANADQRAIDSEYKVFIIDECHSLTSQSWQAFLKCIEEPPKYTIFIFCTTDPQKIPATILNRVMRFNFRKIDPSKIEARLRTICAEEGCTNYMDCCSYISRISNGQLRDAISNLEKCIAYDKDLNMNNVYTALGDLSYQLMFDLFNSIIDGNENNVIEILQNLNNKGLDVKLFVEQLLEFCLDVIKYIVTKDLRCTKFSAALLPDVERLINFDTARAYYSFIMNNIFSLKEAIKNDLNPFSTLQVWLIKTTRGES